VGDYGKFFMLLSDMELYHLNSFFGKKTVFSPINHFKLKSIDLGKGEQ